MAEEPKNPLPIQPEMPAEEAQPALDEASASLANALRTSFRVLTVLIVILIGVFVIKGMFKVEAGDKAVILRFGRTGLDLIKDPGFHYAFPYPIDEVVTIPVKSRTLAVNTFWKKASEQAKEDAVSKGTAAPTIVQGAEDAFMLTGDLNVLNAQWIVSYHIRKENSAVQDWYENVGDLRNEQRLVACALQNAAIRQLGGMKVSDAFPSGQKALEEGVMNALKDTLTRQLRSGLELENVTLRQLRPPDEVKTAFELVLAAKQTAEKRLLDAEAERQKMLIEAAGESGLKLGDNLKLWWAAFEQIRALENTPVAERTADQTARLTALKGDLAKIEQEMHGLYDPEKVGGEVRSMLADAKSYRISIVATAEGDAKQFAYLETLRKTSPREVQVYLEHRRVDALQEVMNNAFELYFFDGGSGKARKEFELWLGRRAELLRQVKTPPQTR